MNSLNAIEERDINLNANKVIGRLKDQGFHAYLVGGCVRDLLLGLTPKDFDIATDARPEEVRDLFRNSRIIGKRFRIVHVKFGREVIEVTPFRGPHAAEYDENHSVSGMPLTDNVYGSFEEDAFRRDFTVNAIYYDPKEKRMVDLAGGKKDLKHKVIRMIGEPEDRFREDPVRMLRAIRFQAKLGFQLEDELRGSVKMLGHLIQDVSPARLFEETLKLFLSGYGAEAFRSMKEHAMYGWLFPQSKHSMKNQATEKLVKLSLVSTDSRIKEGKSVTPAFVLAAMFWYSFVEEKNKLEKRVHHSKLTAQTEAASNVLRNQQLFTAIPKRFSIMIRDIWFLQSHLPILNGKKPDRTIEHRRFRAAYDFLLLRENTGEQTNQLGEWWTEYQDANEERKVAMKKNAHTFKGRRLRGKL